VPGPETGPAGKKRKEDIVADTLEAPLQEVRNNLKSNNLKGLVEIGKALEVVK